MVYYNWCKYFPSGHYPHSDSRTKTIQIQNFKFQNGDVNKTLGA